MQKLSALYMADNKITDLAPLAKLTKLSSLDVSKNQVYDLKPLADVNNLSLLKLSDNAIEDIAPLASQKRLNMLMLQRNKIKDLSPLSKAAAQDAEGPKNFAPFLRVWLEGNPLDNAEGQVAELKKHGVRVEG
jgi:Leucine-rich repeat (LRR) protein